MADEKFISSVTSENFNKALEGGLYAIRHDAQELTDAQKEQARTNIDSLGKDELPDAVDDALAKAKESGEFDGPPGPAGQSGVYVGSGEMPEGYNVQIDPDGSESDLITMVAQRVVENGDLYGEVIGMHALSHSKDGADPITPESIGAALAGYGLGKAATRITSGSINDVWRNGWYDWTTGVSDIPFDWGYMIVASPDSFLTSRTQLIFHMASNAIVKRTLIDGSWMTEWVNPPMQLGVEYRTTERYLGKPVYKQLVNCGTLGVGTASEKASTYKYGIAPDATDIVGYQFTIHRTMDNDIKERHNLPDYSSTGALLAHGSCNLSPAGTGQWDGLYAIVHAFADMSAYTAYLYVAYIKD